MRIKLCIVILFTILVAFMVEGTVVIPDPESRQELGKILFSDPILSSNKSISCASCHKEKYAFADNFKVSFGVRARRGIRNTPSIMNMNKQTAFFWDGRASTLEQQALMPITDRSEMDLPLEEALERLNNSSFYRKAFQKLYGSAATAATLAGALSEFERTLVSTDPPIFDGRSITNKISLSKSAERGYLLFSGKANCIKCHNGENFTSSEFRNVGLYDGKTLRDSGRAVVTKNISDLGKFKVGQLRNVALTAPYMHNGMFKTLKEVVNFYNAPDKVVPQAINRDPILATRLNLSDQEKLDLESFLKSLTDKRFRSDLKIQ